MADWIKAQTNPSERAQLLEAGRAEVEKTVREFKETAHRALDKKYNLLRVSERRWTAVRISQVAAHPDDVITFEQVCKPLPLAEAVVELVKRRKGGA